MKSKPKNESSEKAALDKLTPEQVAKVKAHRAEEKAAEGSRLAALPPHVDAIDEGHNMCGHLNCFLHELKESLESQKPPANQEQLDEWVEAVGHLLEYVDILEGNVSELAEGRRA